MKILVIYDEMSSVARETAEYFIKQEKINKNVYPLQMGSDLKRGKKPCEALCFEEFCLCSIKDMGGDIDEYQYIVVLDEENTDIQNKLNESGTFIHWNLKRISNAAKDKKEKIKNKVETFIRLSERVVA